MAKKLPPPRMAADYPLHPVIDCWPQVGDTDLDELTASIKAEGLRVPLILWEDDAGKVWLVDGRNRKLACERAGVEPTYETWSGVPELEMLQWVKALNHERRHLEQQRRAACFLLWLKLQGQAQWKVLRPTLETPRPGEYDRTARPMPRPAHHLVSPGTKCQGREEDPNDQKASAKLAEAAGVSRSTMDRVLSAVANPGAKEPARFAPVKFDWTKVEAIAQGKASAEKLVRQRDDERRRKELEQAQKQVDVSTAADLRVCSMQDMLAELRDIDAIITDPPYPQEYLPLYEDLARLAVTALKPGGVLAVMCGQSYLPEILALMTKHIPYRWTMSYLTPGGQAVQLWDRKVNTFWKPVLLFGGSEWIGDVVRSDVNDNDKAHHHWGQSESGMSRLVEVLTKPAQLVCDPFLGAGTTGVVAVSLSRRFVGCDIDEKHVETARGRIAEVIRERK